MRCRRPLIRTLAAGLTAVLAVAGMALVAPALPAGAVTKPIDIRAEHDLPNYDHSQGPRVLEVTGVTAGPGPELTVANETENPSDWGGNVLVDVDPAARTITVEVEEYNCYETIDVIITTSEIRSVTNQSDNLFANPGLLDRSETVSDGVVHLSWAASEVRTCPSMSDPGGSAVFAYTVNQPPVADAGPNQTVTLGSGGTADVKLDGSGSSDPDGDALTYTWTGGFQGGSASGVSPTVTFTAAGTHTVTLTVDDGLATDTDTVRITVRAADTAPGPYPPNECSDVPRNVYYTTPFDWAWHTGVTTGVGGSNRCEPLRDVTRAEAVTVLWRTMGSPQVATPHPFTDTVAGAYYQPALRWAAANRHTTGIGGTEANPSSTFGPDLVVDRAEQFTFVWRVMGRPGGPQHPFVDVVPRSFYHPAVNWAADTGVTTGYAGSNRFEPHILVDRAQAFTIAYRLFS
jgi:PKD repeat protein